MSAPATLDAIRAVAEPALYPTHLLAGCDTALIAFCAGFFGRQDGIFIVDAGLNATCIDSDADFLRRMERLYPADWEFVDDDAYEYAAHTDRQWDVVSVDCPTGHFQRCADLVQTWCRAATRAVVLGTGHDTALSPPEGWCVTETLHRSDYRGGVFWSVLEPA